MTIKDRFNVRIARINEYECAVINYRSALCYFKELENDITVFVGTNATDKTVACIVTYCTCSPKAGMSDNDDGMRFHARYCDQFSDAPCKKFECPYNFTKKQYDDMKSVLEYHRKNKKATFRKIFERIK